MSPRKLRKISAEDLYKLQTLTGARISPDGQYVIYVVQRVDAKSEKKYTNLWLAGLENGKPFSKQFTFGDHSDSAPRWSPDGSQIAFLSNRSDKEKPAQIFILPFTGGEARPLTDIEGEIGEFAWSPDGKNLALQVRKTDPEELERKKDEHKKKLGTVARHYTRVFYKLDGYGYLPHERWHIWTVDTTTGKTRQLTDHPVWDDVSPTWTPDGKSLAFVSNRTLDPDMENDANDIFIMPAKGGDARRLNLPIGDKGHMSFSPDGSWLAYYGIEGEGEWYKNTGLWLAPLDGSVPACNLTEPYDIHVSAWTISDQATPEDMTPVWSNDGSTLYFPQTLHGSSILRSIARDGSNLQTVLGEQGVIGSFTFDKSQTHLGYFLGTMTDPGQIYLRNLPSGKSYCLTNHNRALLDEVDLGSFEEAWIKGPDGNDLQGWIITPPGFDPTQKYPSVLEIHGGPLTQYGFYFMHEFYYFASKGYVIHFCNPRGGRGYGEQHAKAIWGGWGEADYADLMAWTDFIADKPYIDPARMGVTGGSYGGYMTVWIIGHTQRFKAAVTQRCVSNFVSMWGSSDFNWTFQLTLSNKAPFEDLQKHWQHSPIAYIGNAKTPTKVIHNENDLRCPIEQGEQVFVALKRLGVETEFVRFPDEFHGLSRAGRTDRRISRLNHIIGWFEKHL